MSESRHAISFNLNGRRHDIVVEARRTLADAIREDCGATGTHTGCEHGICGACTVLLDGAPVRSCLMFAVQADGCEIRSVESLADGSSLSLLQRKFVEHHALQCGFCTPGFLMLATALLDAEAAPSPLEIRDTLSANLCRCTGYQNIAAAVQAALDEKRRE